MPYNKDELQKLLGQHYSPGNLGQSYAGQYKAADSALDFLRTLSPSDLANPEDYGLQESALKSQKASAVAGGVLAGLTGAVQLGTNALQASQIGDTSMYEGQISDLADAGNYNFNTYQQLANAYEQTNFAPVINSSQIRDMSLGQKIGSVGSGALTGAVAGLQIGGPWGALAGGVIGTGTGLWGVLAGDKKAEDEKAYLQSKATAAVEAAQENYNAANERIRWRNTRQGAVNAAAKGGQMKKAISLKEYADKVLRKSVYAQGGKATRIMRRKGEGGTIVRIRVK